MLDATGFVGLFFILFVQMDQMSKKYNDNKYIATPVLTKHMNIDKRFLLLLLNTKG